MKANPVKVQAVGIEDYAAAENVRERFVVFIAGGKRPIISSSNFEGAERLAVCFAGLTKVRMEVFDSLKEICYFVEPCEANRPNIN